MLVACTSAVKSSRRSMTPSTASLAVAGPHRAVPGGNPTLRDIEMKSIQVVLEKHNGNRPAAPKELGIAPKTLDNKIDQLQPT